MTLDPETKARIEAEEAYRKQIRASGTDTGLLWGLIGCALLAAGTLLPVVNLPLVGSMNLIGAGNRDGVILVVLAVLGAWLAYQNRPWILFSAALGGAMLVHKFFSLQAIGTGAVGVEMGWGWLPMVAGVALMVWAGFKLPPE